MRWRSMNALAKSLELSSCAASRVGPMIASPAARNASTMPAASGASGPTTVSPTASAFAKATSSAISVIGTLVSSASSPVPPLPGATKTFALRGLAAIFHASACSRPPEPITSTFTAKPSLQVDLAEHVQHAAMIDAAVELGNVRREHFDALVTDGDEREHGGDRPAAGNVGPLNDRRGKTETGLQDRPIAPVRSPGVADVELRRAVGVFEHEEKDVLGVAARRLACPRPAAAPRILVLLGAPRGRPAVAKLPLVAGDEQAVAASGLGRDHVTAAGFDPRPEVGAFERMRGRGQRKGRRRGKCKSLQEASSCVRRDEVRSNGG